MSDSRDALRIERADANGVRVSGAIGFADASEAVKRTGELFAGGAKDVAVDLGGMSRADSATLGVLLIWAATAATRGVKLRFVNPPKGLQALAHLCDAEPLLGLA
ncbi:MAG TPA: STAS domain-containing protein [Rhodanobacteraceae bacterium]|nr:STAS domain-containing protein [Rhodanobacteraceae bacterium]